jgi:hypothetical protein
MKFCHTWGWSESLWTRVHSPSLPEMVQKVVCFGFSSVLFPHKFVLCDSSHSFYIFHSYVALLFESLLFFSHL